MKKKKSNDWLGVFNPNSFYKPNKSAKKYVKATEYGALRELATKYGEANEKANKLLEAVNNADLNDTKVYKVQLNSLELFALRNLLLNESFDLCKRLISYKQRINSQKERPDALQSLIDNIVTRKPTISITDLIDALVKEINFGVISGFEDENIEWQDKNGRIKDTPVSALKDRLSRSKNKIKKSR